MKRTIAIALSALILTGCGGTSQSVAETERTTETTVTTTTAVSEDATTEMTTTTKPETTTAPETTTTTIPEPGEGEEGGIFDVEHGVFVTTITVPLSKIENPESFDPEQQIVKMQDGGIDGVLSCTVEDGNVIYKIKTSEYNKWKKETIENIDKMLDDIASDETNTFTKFECDDDLANINVYVTSESEYKAGFDGISLWGVVYVIQTVNSLIDMFSETTTFHIIDGETGNVFLETTMP